MIELTLAALVAAVTVFVLAIFLGFEIISKVPPTLHTPLMSGANAISGITVVGALLLLSNAALSDGDAPLAAKLAVVSLVVSPLVDSREVSSLNSRQVDSNRVVMLMHLVQKE